MSRTRRLRSAQLGDDDGGFDGFAEADFIGEDDAFRERRLDGEQGGIDLVGVEVHLGGGEGCRQALDSAAGAALGQEGGPVLAVIMC